MPIASLMRAPKRRKSVFLALQRTQKGHPDYQAAEAFSRALAERGWISITGGGSGVMMAGLTGSSSTGSFGLCIRLPFESTAPSDLPKHSKLIQFRYFLYPQINVHEPCKCLCHFPGGFGTMDELFETLTLMQTGRSSIVPIVIDWGRRGALLALLESYLKENLLGNGWSVRKTGISTISPPPPLEACSISNSFTAATTPTAMLARRRSSAWNRRCMKGRLRSSIANSAGSSPRKDAPITRSPGRDGPLDLQESSSTTPAAISGWCVALINRINLL